MFFSSFPTRFALEKKKKTNQSHYLKFLRFAFSVRKTQKRKRKPNQTKHIRTHTEPAIHAFSLSFVHSHIHAFIHAFIQAFVQACIRIRCQDSFFSFFLLFFVSLILHFMIAERLFFVFGFIHISRSFVPSLQKFAHSLCHSFALIHTRMHTKNKNTHIHTKNSFVLSFVLIHTHM